MKRWYVVQTRPRAEEWALRHLGNQGFDCFLPRLRRLRTHARRTRALLEPLFPRYLFTCFDLDAAAWRSIDGTRGVVRLLADGPRPTPVPPGVVEGLIAGTDDEGMTSLTALGVFRKGRRVEVEGGAFRGRSGEFEAALCDGRARVTVLLKLLGAPASLELASYAIQTA